MEPIEDVLLYFDNKVLNKEDNFDFEGEIEVSELMVVQLFIYYRETVLGELTDPKYLREKIEGFKSGKDKLYYRGHKILIVEHEFSNN